MKTSLRTMAAGLAGTVVLTTGVGTAAGASTTAAARGPLATAKAACNRKITERVIALHGLETRVQLTQRLSPEQKAPMVASIDESIALLNTLYRGAVNSATTRSALKQACQSIFVDLRIFAVYIPQTRFGGQLDALANWKDALTGKVDAAEGSGTDTTELEALLQSAQAGMDEAAVAIPTVTPATFNGDPAGTRATWDHVHKLLVDAFIDLLHVHRALNPAPAP